MGLEINQERGVHLTATEGEIIDTEDPWGWRRREDGVTQQTEQCHPQAGTRTDGQTRGASQTCSGLSSCRLCQIEEECASVRGATNSGEERCPEALGKGAAPQEPIEKTLSVTSLNYFGMNRACVPLRPGSLRARVSIIWMQLRNRLDIGVLQRNCAE